MRVHLRNVVESAIERGLVVGHHRVSKLPKQQQKDIDAFVDTMLKSVWESLDGIIDFSDDGPESDENDDADRPRIGFHSVEAIGGTAATPNEDEDDDDAVVPLDVLHRIHSILHRRKP